MVIDVSIHDGAINWQKVKASGVEAVVIRCGYGRDFTKYDDGNFKKNIEGALSVGLVVGIYLYSYAKDKDGALSEAKHALRLASPYKDKIKLPIYYDLEEAGTESGAKERAVVFCEAIQKAGYQAGVYASYYWWTTYLKGLDAYTKWVAKWREDGKPIAPPQMEGLGLWQYYAYGRVDGIVGARVDLSEAYGDIKKIIDGNEPEPTPTPTPTPTPKEDKVVVTLSVLKKGSKGEEVKTLQRLLKELGYKGSNRKVLAVDGSFGGNTEYAVKNFQEDFGLNVDGVVGSATWNGILKG